MSPLCPCFAVYMYLYISPPFPLYWLLPLPPYKYMIRLFPMMNYVHYVLKKIDPSRRSMAYVLTFIAYFFQVMNYRTKKMWHQGLWIVA